MSFYDFFWRNQQVTALGEHLMRQSALYALSRLGQSDTLPGKIVEIGPGWGSFAAVCRERGVDYVAVDVNPGMLKRLEHADGICSFVPPLPLADSACDVVFASHVLEHCESLSQAQAFVGEMQRIVRPGGCVAVVSPDLLWYKNHFWDGDYSHNFPTSARRLNQLFFDQRLEVERLEYVHNHLTGVWGYLAGVLTGLLPYRLAGATPLSPFYIDRMYRNRLTFSRAVFILGRRVAPSRQGRSM